MTNRAPTMSIGQLSIADRESLAELAARVAADETLTPGARAFAAEMLSHAAEKRRVAADESEFLTANSAAVLVGVSRPILNRLLGEGRIPFHLTPGGHRRIKRSDVLAYIENRDAIAVQLAEARRSRRSVGEEIADDLGLSEAEARQLGFS